MECCRKLVCMGELGVCADDPRRSAAKTGIVVWKRGGALSY